MGFMISIIYLASTADSRRSEERKTARVVWKNYRRAKKKIPLEIADAETKTETLLTTLRQQYSEEIERVNKHIADLEMQIQNIQKTLAQKIKPYGDTHVVLLGLIEKLFSMYLTQRDWHNLDNVIYYLLSGRAETIKEALVTIDAQKPDIREINAAIQSDLRSSVDDMQTQFARIADNLSYQLHRSYDENTVEGKAKIEEIIPLITPEALKNALLDKADVSSETLLEQIAWLQGRIK